LTGYLGSALHEKFFQLLVSRTCGRLSGFCGTDATMVPTQEAESTKQIV
jgi:hypothetical protein